MSHKKDKPVTIELNPIPLETIRSLFCLDLPEVYQNGFSFEAPFTPHQMVTAILRSIALEKMADEFDEAGKTPLESHYSVGCITTPNGSCFAYARHRNKNGAYHLTFVSANIEPELNAENKPVFNIDHQSIVTGIESKDAGEKYFDPFACLCLSTIDDNLNTQLIEPQNANDFYASLCYMQQSMASCIAGDDLDLFKNQCWLDPIVTKRAFEEFSNIVGAMSVEDVVKTYHDHLNMMDELLEEIKAEADGQGSHYSELKPLLN